MQPTTSFILYTRKSTDERSRQIRSLDAQLREGRALAAKYNFSIVDELKESQTAKEPGRPFFNDMIRRIGKGEVQGIIAWHPNRLARNAIDGGVIIDLLSRGLIKELKFASYNFDNSPEGKMWLYMAFAQSTYEVDKLSADTKRGLEEKVLRGEYPGRAPTGFRNNKATKLMVPHPIRIRLVQQLFKSYGTGSHSFRTLSEAMAARGLRSRKRKPLSISSIEHILKNPFYYGDFLYNDELHHGIHKPAISKSLFDRCQAIMKRRAHPMVQSQRSFAFRSLIRCGECDAAITSEIQKGHAYYRCTKKKGPCSQPYIREEALDDEISRLIRMLALAPQWAKWFLLELDTMKHEMQRSTAEERDRLRGEVNSITVKLDILLDARLNDELGKEEFLAKKNKLRRHQADLSEKLTSFTANPLVRLEPVRQLILTCSKATQIHSSKKLIEKREFLQNLGSNLTLYARTVHWPLPKRWKHVVDSVFLGRALVALPLTGTNMLPCVQLCWGSWRISESVSPTDVSKWMKFGQPQLER